MTAELRLFDEPVVVPDRVVADHPVGVVVESAFGADGLATATFDTDGVYRFRLSRVWDAQLPRVAWLMLNPSTADHLVVDPTVRRCINFAKAWGAGGIEVVNVFALRSTDPRALRVHADPVGAGNDEAITRAAQAAEIVVAAWGVHATLTNRDVVVRDLLADAGIVLQCLKLTKDGHPGHPLYIKDDTPLIKLPSRH